MKRKKVEVTVRNTKDYLRLMNGLFGLTKTEIEILADFISARTTLRKNGLEISPFSTPIKKKVAEKQGREDFNTLNNYIMSMHRKGAIFLTEENGYDVHPFLVPQGEAEVVFQISYPNSNRQEP